MIYKFNDKEQGTFLEVELQTDCNKSLVVNQKVCLSITCEEIQEDLSVQLSEKDIYHLIGALHLLHKEMK